MDLMNDLIITRIGSEWEMNRINIPTTSGVYFIYNSNKEVIYIGQTKNLLKRTTEHFYQDSWFKLFARYLSFVETPIEELREKEYSLIQEFRPKFNFEHYTGVTEEQMSELARAKPIL